MIEININLQKIEILKEYFPKEALELQELLTKDISWRCSFNFKIGKSSKMKQEVFIDLGYKMIHINDPLENAIVELKIRSHFTAEGNPDSKGKLYTLYQLIAFTTWNFQGVFAAKTQGTKLSNEPPPETDFKQFENSFLKRIENDWK